MVERELSGVVQMTEPLKESGRRPGGAGPFSARKTLDVRWSE